MKRKQSLTESCPQLYCAEHRESKLPDFPAYSESLPVSASERRTAEALRKEASADELVVHRRAVWARPRNLRASEEEFMPMQLLLAFFTADRISWSWNEKAQRILNHPELCPSTVFVRLWRGAASCSYVETHSAVVRMLFVSPRRL